VGVEINQDYYIKHVLENYLFKHVKNLQGKDNAPSHKAKRAETTGSHCHWILFGFKIHFG
jgi:hypothetical protein